MLDLKKPKEAILHYRITTPMFLGEADAKSVDAKIFRNASYKGALRFWWRATQWGKFLSEAGRDVRAALSELHKKEGELFGLASDGENSKQSCVRIRSTIEGAERNSNGSISSLSYLLGQGLYHFKNGVLREYISGGDIHVTLVFDAKAADADIQSVERAAIALGLFGGLGSRSRKGLGSLSLQSITHTDGKEESFIKLSDIETFIGKLDFPEIAEPPLTALSKASRIVVTGKDSSASRALKAVGDEMQLYRSYGRRNDRSGQHEVNGKPARQNFKDDHDFVHKALSENKKLISLPERAVFGLPHNYFFGSLKMAKFDKMDIAPKGKSRKEKGRRASPLFIHIHALGDGFVAIQTLLPALFLHKDISVEAEPAKGKEVRGVTHALQKTDTDYRVIHNYLDGFKNDPAFKELRRHG